MLERTVYFSGITGTDKTGLIAELLERNEHYIPGAADRWREKERAPDLYVKALIDDRAHEARHHAELEQQHPDKVVLAEWSIHDTTAYILGLAKRGILGKDDAEELLTHQHLQYDPALLPKRTVFLDYKLEDVMRRFETERGWRTHQADENVVKHNLDAYRRYFDSLSQGNDLLRLYVDDAKTTAPIVESWMTRRTGI